MDVKSLLKRFPGVDNLYIRYKWRERRVSWGKENPDKIFFVVRRATCKVGLFSYVMTNIGLVKQAIDKGYIPVIDMCGNANTYLEEDEIGRKNAWEFYFEQPCGYTLEDISKSRNVILSCGLVGKKDLYPGHNIIKNKGLCAEWRKFCAEFLIVKPDIKRQAEEMYRDFFKQDKVLGVLCRGTDYRNIRPKNHPVQPELNEVLEKVRIIQKEYRCRWIYLATEDEDIYQSFQKAFGDRLKVTNARRCSNTGMKNINDIDFLRARDKYLKGKDYLINILLLAKCNCLIAGSVGGTYGALLMSRGYEYEYVFDLGTY